jgi:hypothetical protein
MVHCGVFSIISRKRIPTLTRVAHKYTITTNLVHFGIRMLPVEHSFFSYRLFTTAMYEGFGSAAITNKRRPCLEILWKFLQPVGVKDRLRLRLGRRK